MRLTTCKTRPRQATISLPPLSNAGMVADGSFTPSHRALPLPAHPNNWIWLDLSLLPAPTSSCRRTCSRTGLRSNGSRNSFPTVHPIWTYTTSPAFCALAPFWLTLCTHRKKISSAAMIQAAPSRTALVQTSSWVVDRFPCSTL